MSVNRGQETTCLYFDPCYCECDWCAPSKTNKGNAIGEHPLSRLLKDNCEIYVCKKHKKEALCKGWLPMEEWIVFHSLKNKQNSRYQGRCG